MLTQEERNKWLQVRSDIEISTDSWLTMTIKCLTMIAQRPNCVNVIVTNNQLVAALSKILLFGLAQIFSVENIYSTNKIGKCSIYSFILNSKQFLSVRYYYYYNGEHKGNTRSNYILFNEGSTIKIGRPVKKLKRFEILMRKRTFYQILVYILLSKEDNGYHKMALRLLGHPFSLLKGRRSIFIEKSYLTRG